MNKTDVIKEFSKKSGFSIEKSTKINEVFEKNLILGKKCKEKIVADLKMKLGINEEKADKIYNDFSSIIGNGVLGKMRNPFMDLDKNKFGKDLIK